MAKGKSEHYWKEKVLEWQVSGKSSKAWCQENKIPLTTFHGWKQRLKKLTIENSKTACTKDKAEFIELKDQAFSDPHIILECEGVKIYLQQGFDLCFLKQCIACLRGTLC